MFKASIFIAIVVALLLGIYSHATGSIAGFKVVLIACAYLAFCAIAKGHALASTGKK